MPDKLKYKPFSKEEKEYILKRHKELVDNMNKYLPQEQQLFYDKDLEAKLDDQKVVGQYRIAQEIKEVQQKQAQIQKDLQARFGKSQHDPDPLSRTIVYAFDPKDTPEAKQYNERLYKDYLNDPDKVVYLRYKKVLDFNPKQIYDLKDDKLKLAEFYRDNYPLCDEAFAFTSVVNRSNLTPALKDSLKSISAPLETVGFPQLTMHSANSLDFFACPDLNLQQADIIMNNDHELLDTATPELFNTLNYHVQKTTMESPTSYFGKFVENKQKFEDGYFIKNRPEKVEIVNGEPVIKEAKYDQVFNQEPGQFRISQRSADDVFEMTCMTKSFQREYLYNFQNQINNQLNRTSNFDIDRILKERQGGFWERRIKHSTSQEYKDFEKAFRDYNDPNSPDYCRKEKLKNATDAYLNHKGVQDENDLSRLSGTSLIRSELALAVRGALNDQEALAGMVEEQWLDEYQVEVSRQPFLKAEEVEDNGVNVKEMHDDMEKDLEIEDDLNNSMDMN